MRFAACAVSAILLSGCSWFGGGGSHGGQYNYESGRKASQHSGYATNQNNAYSSQQRCQIPSSRHPVPRGCDPASVTIGTGQAGFPQQPQYGQPAQYGQQSQQGQYATQGYGSHAGSVGQTVAYQQPRDRFKKPRWRGALTLGAEKSVSGELLNYDKVTVLDPLAGYLPQLYNEGGTEGSVGTGSVIEHVYTGDDTLRNGVVDPFTDAPQAPFWDEAHKPSISFDDAHSTPVRIAGGLEYIASPHATIFANAGYSHAEGEHGIAASIEGTLYHDISIQDYDGMGVAIGGPTTSTEFLPNQTFAEFAYDFTDMKRYDFELGGRYYLDPIVKTQGYKTLTPFVGAAAGISHLNGVSYTIEQSQRYYARAFDSPPTEEYYQIPGASPTVNLYDSQWLASGQINAGVEWQVTPKTALAFETGVRIEQAREYSDGTKGDSNVAIPFNIRGSYNF